MFFSKKYKFSLQFKSDDLNRHFCKKKIKILRDLISFDKLEFTLIFYFVNLLIQC